MKALLKSKLIECVDYDDNANRLKIYLTNGQRREFRDVPMAVYQGFLNADSPGNYYVNEVRGHFSQTTQ